MATCDFKGGNFTMEFECGPVEPVSKKVERLEQELAEAKAKLAAEAEAKKPKTRGAEVAEGLIQPYAGYQVSLRDKIGLRYFAPVPGDTADLLTADLRQIVSAAIDAEIEKAKAEQREKDAVICEKGAADYLRDGGNSLAVLAMQARAADIRYQK